MALAHFQRTFTDTAGNVQPGIEVTIRNESTGALAAIYEDSAGNTAKANPFTTDSFGYGDFYAADGRYRIQATGIDWRNEEVLTFENLQAAVDDAESFAQAAALNAGIYEDTTAGLAATSDGEYFSTPAAGADEYLTLYLNDAGSAVEIDTYPNKQAIDNLGLSSTDNGSDLVAHTGTGDTVTETLDRHDDEIQQRTIYVGSVAELEALSLAEGVNVYLTQEGRAGEFVVKTGTPPSDPQKGIYIVLANGNYAERIDKINLTVCMFGAAGDGVADDGAAVRGAIESLPEGGNLFFEPGVYTTIYGDKNDINDWILIQENGCRLWAEPGTVTLQNFLIAVYGTFDAAFDVGSGGFTAGDEVASTSSAHGYSKGDVIQFLSQINSYSRDAGDYQLGSRNPTTNILPERRFSEIHEIAEIIDSTSFRLDGSVLYGNYDNNVSSLSDPMTGVTSAQIRKINAVKGITFYGLIFKNVDNTSFAQIGCTCAYRFTLEKCGFIAEGDTGVHFRASSSFGISFVDCWDRRNPVDASGSSWNSFRIEGGCQQAFFYRCDIKGGQQAIDWTSGVDSNWPFYDSLYLDGMTTQVIGAIDCVFNDCSDAATSHPGTYLCIFKNNVCNNVNTGFRGRSRNMLVSGNLINANSNGVSLSAFYDQTTVSSNNIRQVFVDRFSGGNWTGVTIAPMSSEVMNKNDLEYVVISSNSFFATANLVGDMGVQIRHTGNGVPPNENFNEFVDDIKTNLSNYVIQNNSFQGCSVRINKFVNGVSCINNYFDRCAHNKAYFESQIDSVRQRVGLNVFDGNQPTNSVVIAGPDSLTYSYTTRSRVSNNQYCIGIANNDLLDTDAFKTD